METQTSAPITLTEEAAVKVHEFMAATDKPQEDSVYLRVGVQGGGCSGFQYQLAFDYPSDDDIQVEDQGVTLLVAADSLEYIQGSVIEWEQTLMAQGFRVNNPNVVAACGCGSSFRVADEEEPAAVTSEAQDLQFEFVETATQTERQTVLTRIGTFGASDIRPLAHATERYIARGIPEDVLDEAIEILQNNEFIVVAELAATTATDDDSPVVTCHSCS